MSDTTEHITPDAVGTMVPYGAFQEVASELASHDPLSPCPACGKSRNEAPEGVQTNGDPNWIHDYCWKCGFRPGTNTAVSETELRKQFAAFKEFIAAQPAMQHPTLQPPDPSQVDAMQAQINALQEELAQSRGNQ